MVYIFWQVSWVLIQCHGSATSAPNPICISADATVWELKKKIEENNNVTNLPAIKQDLVHEGMRLLGDLLPLRYYKITNNTSSYLHLYEKIQVTVYKDDLPVPITANDGMTVGHLRKMVLDVFHHYCSEHYALERLNGELLHNDVTLSAANIVDGTRLNLVFRLYI